MRIKAFRIENYKNIQLAEVANLPDFVVICGGNGSGKSSILEALLTIRNFLAHQVDKKQRFQFDTSVISADSQNTSIQVTFQFTIEEIEYINKKFAGRHSLPEEHTIKVILKRNDDPNLKHDPNDIDDTFINDNKSYLDQIEGSDAAVFQLLYEHKAGVSVFDYFSSNREYQKQEVNSWSTSFLNRDSQKQILIRGSNKYNNIKQYLLGIKIDDLRRIQLAQKNGNSYNIDSLNAIKDFFKKFLAPMEFIDIDLTVSPFRFIINTPRGEIDINGLSSGEKEILFTYVHFKKFGTRDSVILFDEPDAHLHPELETSYLKSLKELSEGNQFFITTHSPNMMIESGTESLYTLIKHPKLDENQFTKITDDKDKYVLLSELMGNKGFVSLNRKIIFIEGETSSSDIEIYETFFPSNENQVSYIPAGNSGTVRKTSEKVNELLTSSIGYEHFYSIVDGDYQRIVDDPTGGKRLFRLPVYHVENYIIDEAIIFSLISKIKRKSCTYKSALDITNELKKLLTDSHHLASLGKAIYDAKIASLKNEVEKEIFQSKELEVSLKFKRPEFQVAEKEAFELMKAAIKNNTWKEKCKGRELLKAFCGKNNIEYIQFKNLLLDQFNCEKPPLSLKKIMDKIIVKPKNVKSA